MRHRGRSDFPGLRLFVKQVAGNVRPEILIQINDNIVDLARDVEIIRPCVVIFDLRGGEVRRQAQLLDESGGKGHPIVGGKGGEHGGKIPHRAVEFAAKSERLQFLILAQQPVDEDRDFLSGGCRRGFLPMRPRRKRDSFPRFGQFAQFRNQLPDLRRVLLRQIPLEHQIVGEVVDIFRRQAEVNQIVVAQPDFVAQKHFTRLDIVPRRRFNRFNLLIIVVRKRLQRQRDARALILRKRRKQAGFIQRKRVAKFDFAPRSHQRIF